MLTDVWLDSAFPDAACTISSASNMQKIAVNAMLFTIAIMIMFHLVEAKFSPNFDTLEGKWVVITWEQQIVMLAW